MRIILATFATILATGTAGAEPLRDLTGAYFARETREGRDNDILRLTYGVTFNGGRSATRLAVSGGIRNEQDFNGPFDADLGLEALHALRRDSAIWGGAVRLGHVTARETSFDLGLFGETYRADWTLRGGAGVQALSGASVAPLAMAEADWYLRPNLVVRVGLALDDDDVLSLVGAEIAHPRYPVSFYLDWVHGLPAYRGNRGYNDLIGGIRYTYHFGDLKTRDRRAPWRLFRRAVDGP